MRLIALARGRAPRGPGPRAGPVSRARSSCPGGAPKPARMGSSDHSHPGLTGDLDGMINERLKTDGKKRKWSLVPVPEALEEDLLEMLNAGLVKIVVVDSHKANFWKQVFPKLALHPDVAA